MTIVIPEMVYSTEEKVSLNYLLKHGNLYKVEKHTHLTNNATVISWFLVYSRVQTGEK